MLHDNDSECALQQELDHYSQCAKQLLRDLVFLAQRDIYYLSSCVDLTPEEMASAYQERVQLIHRAVKRTERRWKLEERRAWEERERKQALKALDF